MLRFRNITVLKTITTTLLSLFVSNLVIILLGTMALSPCKSAPYDLNVDYSNVACHWIADSAIQRPTPTICLHSNTTELNSTRRQVLFCCVALLLSLKMTKKSTAFEHLVVNNINFIRRSLHWLLLLIDYFKVKRWKVMYSCYWNSISELRYWMPRAIRDHTVLLVIRHKWTHPALTPTRQASTRVTYRVRLAGWVDLLNAEINWNFSELLTRKFSLILTIRHSSHFFN